MVTKLITKNIFLRTKLYLVERELNKSRKTEKKALEELKESQENNVFLIDENDMLKGKLMKYVKEEDDKKGKALKKKLDKEIKDGKK